MKITPWPTNARSPIVTPSQTNAWLWILQSDADRRAALNLDERPDPRPGADPAAVEVGERLHDDVLPEDHLADQPIRGLVRGGRRRSTIVAPRGRARHQSAKEPRHSSHRRRTDCPRPSLRPLAVIRGSGLLRFALRLGPWLQPGSWPHPGEPDRGALPSRADDRCRARSPRQLSQSPERADATQVDVVAVARRHQVGSAPGRTAIEGSPLEASRLVRRRTAQRCRSTSSTPSARRGRLSSSRANVHSACMDPRRRPRR